MKTLAESLKPVLVGFRKISEKDKLAYLDYVALLIERQKTAREKKTLIKFKRKLENEFQKHSVNA